MGCRFAYGARRGAGAVFRGLALWFALALVPPSAAMAQAPEALGSRALGMAGAFTAVADDASAMYWNPAGLATGGPVSLVWDWSRGETRPEAGATPPEPAARHRGVIVALTTYPLGIGHYRLSQRQIRPLVSAAGGPEDREHGRPAGWTLTSLVTNQTGLTVLQSLAQGVVVGATVKYIRGAAGREVRFGPGRAGDWLDAAETLEDRVSGRLAVDLGAMAGGGRIRAGLVVRNVGEPEFATPDGDSLVLERQTRAGVAVMPSSGLTVALDVDLSMPGATFQEERMVALGAEQWLLGRLVGVRGGVRFARAGDRRPVGAAGLSVALRPGIWVEAQMSAGSSSAGRSWSVATRMGY